MRKPCPSADNAKCSDDCPCADLRPISQWELEVELRHEARQALRRVLLAWFGRISGHPPARLCSDLTRKTEALLGARGDLTDVRLCYDWALTKLREGH